jgi:multiple sugar transport system substrate-binding protein
MRTRRSLSIFTVLLCLAALSVTPASATGKQETEAATISFWTGYAECLPVFNAAGADYTKEHPNIKFEFASFSLREEEQKLQVSMSGGTAPDISDLGSTLTLRNGSQGFLDPVPAQYADWIKQNYDTVYTDALTNSGKLYGMPFMQGFQVLYYNLDDFAAAGITKPPATLTELMDTAKKLTKYDANGKVTHSGISLRLSGQGSGIAEKWEIFLFANGGMVLEPTGPGKWKAGFNNDAGYEALNFYLNALYKHKVDSFDVQHDQAAFVGGVASMFNRETNIIGAMRDQAPTKKYGITQAVGASSRGTNLNVGALVVPSSGKHKAIAWDFVKYLMQDKYAVQMMRDVGWIYCRKGVDYAAVYAKEPHFQQSLDRPAGFKLYVSPPAVSWAEVYTNLATALTVAYTDASLMDNKPKIMAWLAAQADAANKVLQNNKEF